MIKTNFIYLVLLLSMSTALTANVFTGKIHQGIDAETIKLNQESFDESLNHIELWEAIQDLAVGDSGDNLSELYCKKNVDKIDGLLEKYFYSIQIQKIALDCHNLLAQTKHATDHETHLINLAQLITASGDGKSYDSAFWISDIDSAYEFLKMAGFDVIDGEFKLHNKNTYLAVYARGEDIFGDYRYFQLNNFFTNINNFIDDNSTEEEMKDFKVIDIVLKTALENNQGLFVLAYADITEAQILIAKLLLQKAKVFPTLYIDALHFLEKAANQGSVIAKYNYAYRIFIDKMEDKYTEGHELITDALSDRYLPAMTLAAVVREQKLGIKKEKKTVANIISLLDERGEPGEYELLIGSQLINTYMWNNHKLAKKYLEKATEKNNPQAMILMGNLYDLGYSVKQNKKKAFKWYKKASSFDSTGNALLKLGLYYIFGLGVDKDIKLATDTLIKAGDLGNNNGYTLAGKLLYFKEYGQVNYQQAFVFFKKAHELGDSEATFGMARSIFHGHGTEQDYKKAFDLFKSIENKGIKDVETYLCAAYFSGLGTDKNTNKSIKIIRNILQRSNAYQQNKKNLILANLNLRLYYSGINHALTPDDQLVESLNEKMALNDANAIFNLGYLNYMTYEPGMTREYGVTLLKKAAKLNVPYAHTQLANYYHLKDETALQQKHLKKARELGEPEAIYKLAIKLLEKDPDKAISLLKQATEKKQIYAIYKLADFYYKRKDKEPDYLKAYTYYQQALLLGSDSVYDELLTLYSEQHITKEQFSGTLIKMELEAERKKSARMMRKLAKFYSFDHLPEFNPQKTIQWYIKAYESGDAEAIIELGKRYLYGTDLGQNFDMAQFFFANATAKPTSVWSNLMDEPGSFWIALMLENGLGLEKDIELAKNIYESNFFSIRNKEAKNNFAVITCQTENIKRKLQKKAFKIISELSKDSRTALFNLGWMNEHAICTKKNTQAAISAYQKSAKMNSPHALFRLHQLHTEGHLVKKDDKLANEYLKQSIEASNKVLYHNMMSTFLDLPYINKLKITQMKSN